MTKRIWIGSTVLSAALLLGACSDDEATTETEQTEETENVEEVEQTTASEPVEEVQEVEDGLARAPEDFQATYNGLVDTLAPGLIPHLTAGAKTDGAVQDTITYDGGPSVAINATIKKETGLANGFTFIGVPDGSEDSGFQVIAGMGIFIGAIDPSLTADDRNDVLKELGMMDDDFNILDHEGKTTKNGFDYHLSTSEHTGIMLSVGK